MDKPRLICEKCKYETIIDQAFIKHLNTELHKTGKRKSQKRKDDYKCNICEFHTRGKVNFKVHMLNNHSTKEEREKGYKYYCKYCDFGNFVENSFKSHLETEKHKRKTLFLNQEKKE